MVIKIFLKFSIENKKEEDFVEFNVYLIQRKQNPLIHKTVLILCYEGDALKGVNKVQVSLPAQTCSLEITVCFSSGKFPSRKPGT